MMPPNVGDRNFTPYTEKDLLEARPQIRAVCFDGFGTLVDIQDQRRPFKALLGNGAASETVVRALTTPTSLRDLARDLALDLDNASLSILEANLETELSSTRLRAGIEALWEALRRVGLRVGVCSNLAAPYQHALLGCLPRVPDALALSFQLGLIKPQAEIYQKVCTLLRLAPKHVLFVGDRLDEDVFGPQRAGLFAMHIDEFERALSQGPASAMPSAVVELISRITEFSQEPRALQRPSPRDALDSSLRQVNVSKVARFNRRQLLHVLRSPFTVMEGDDPELKHLLCAFLDETDETLLIQIGEGTEIGWAKLAQAARAALRPGNLKLDWIAAREITSSASRP